MSRPLAGRGNFEGIFVYYDEPQVMLLSRSDDRKIIAVAISLLEHNGLQVPDESYPFFAAEISFNQLDRYLRGVTDLRYLFLYPKYKKWYLFDYALLDQRNRVPLANVPRDAIDPQWLPEAGFFSREHTEEFASQAQDLQVRTFQIDGSWDFADFSRFYGKFAEVYSLFLALSKFANPDIRLDTKKIIKQAFTHYPFMGGSSYRNFYGDLLSAQSYSDRLSVREIAYASPGHVDVFAKVDIFQKVVISLNYFAQHQIEAAASYKMLRDYLGKSRLLRSDATEFVSHSGAGAYIKRLTEELCANFGFSQLEEVYDLVENNALAAAKVMLSYARRVERSYMFFAEGRVRIG